MMLNRLLLKGVFTPPITIRLPHHALRKRTNKTDHLPRNSNIIILVSFIALEPANCRCCTIRHDRISTSVKPACCIGKGGSVFAYETEVPELFEGRVVVVDGVALLRGEGGVFFLFL